MTTSQLRSSLRQLGASDATIDAFLCEVDVLGACKYLYASQIPGLVAYAMHRHRRANKAQLTVLVTKFLQLVFTADAAPAQA